VLYQPTVINRLEEKAESKSAEESLVQSTASDTDSSKLEEDKQKMEDLVKSVQEKLITSREKV
jgi:hypothetical protein